MKLAMLLLLALPVVAAGDEVKPVEPTPAPAINAKKAAHTDDVLPFAHALVWAGLPKAFDIWSTAECIERNHACAEGNPVQPTAEHRGALMAAAIVGAAYAFYEIENAPVMRKHRWLRRVPRFLWAAFHIAVGVHNLRLAGQAR